MAMTQERAKQQRMPLSSRSSSFFVILLFLCLSAIFPSVQAADTYSFQVPTAATIWTPGQAGVVTITSTDKATASTKPTDRLLTISLRVVTSIVGTWKEVTVIQDRLQLLVPVGSLQTEVSSTIGNWIVPSNIPPGSKYYVHLERAKTSWADWIPLTESSPNFQIVAPVAPLVPSASSVPTATTQPPTNSTSLPTMSATTATTPTASSLPPGTTCDDIRQRCVAQSLTYVDTVQGTLCHCGVALITPNIVGSHGNPSLQKVDSSVVARLFSIVILTHLLVSVLAA